MVLRESLLGSRMLRAGCLGLLAFAASACSSSGRDSEVGLAPSSAGTGGAAAGGSSGTAGGGGLSALQMWDPGPPPDFSFPNITETCPGGMGAGGIRCIPDKVLARPGVCYSGYRNHESPNIKVYPTADEVKQDLQLVLHAGFGFIRLFDASQHAVTVLQVISDNQLDLKVQLGVWIAGPKATQDSANQDQITKGIALANMYPDTVVSLSVGNEVLDTWSSIRTPAEDLVDYMKQVRAGVKQPVTTDDMYPPFELTGYDGVLAVAQTADYLSIHDYAALDADYSSWDFEQKQVAAGPDRAKAMMQAAVAYTKVNIKNVRSVLAKNGVNIPIIIGEAGWRSRNQNPSAFAEKYYSHPVNQKMFFDGLEAWVYGADKDADSPRGAFYFEAFDEPWKSTDDAWGLFDVNRVPNYTEWANFPTLKPADVNYTDADALYYTGD